MIIHREACDPIIPQGVMSIVETTSLVPMCAKVLAMVNWSSFSPSRNASEGTVNSGRMLAFLCKYYSGARKCNHGGCLL